MGRLDAYRAKRDFDATPEPAGGHDAPGPALRYSIQNHAATRLHWDLRLEWDGVLLSWAVTRGPSLDPADKRLAVETEDHPIDYLDFEGTIPKGNYGAGTVMLWDIGHWQPLSDVDAALTKGHLHFQLHGRRMTGRWNLVRMGREGKRVNWLLMKEEDEAAHGPDPVARYRTSVATGRDMAAIAAAAPAATPRARKGRAPRWRQPQLATLAQETGDPATRWHELKFDGYRALVALGKGGARVFTRNGHDWSDRFAPLLAPLGDLPCDTALIDGEITAGAGLYGFSALQGAIRQGGPFTFHAFDLIHLDGTDLAAQPLTARRDALETLFSDVPPLGLLQLSPVLRGDAAKSFETVCAIGGEGLISKRMDAPYRGGRSRAWEKIKCEKRAEFAIVGFQPSDKRGRPFASLALGQHEGDRLVYAGKVGTGFDADTMEDLARAMRPLVRTSPAVDGVPKAEARGVTWLVPRLVAEVRYAETTAEGRVRHAVFLGRREDKPVTEVRRERPVEAPSGALRVAGIAISSPDRRVFPEATLTKADVARYYASVADRMLADARDRPMSLLRLPEGLAGERFFQRHAGKGFPEAIRSVEIAEKDGARRDYMAVRDAAGLVGAVQMGTIEFHVWGSRTDRLERPDRMVFDLDPDEGLEFDAVRRAGLDMRDRLADLGLPSWPLLTGGKGVHVVVELRRTRDWPVVTLFARTFAELCARDAPDRYTASLSKSRRRGRIFIDWMRNERGATAICPWSLRARPGAPVAVPVRWEELPRIAGADAFGPEAALRRKAIARPNPATLSASVLERLEARVAGG